MERDGSIKGGGNWGPGSRGGGAMRGQEWSGDGQGRGSYTRGELRASKKGVSSRLHERRRAVRRQKTYPLSTP